jgi:outer membrane protein assembly factor BamB
VAAAEPSAPAAGGRPRCRVLEHDHSDGRALYAGGASDNLITALAASTGKTLWTHRLSAPAQDATATDDVLYVIDANATVHAIQA